MDNSKSRIANIEYVIFDMDGLLTSRVRRSVLLKDDPLMLLMHLYSDSERIYTDVTNEILDRYGYKMTWEIKSGLMGKVQRQAAEYLYSFFPGLEDKLSIDDYLTERVQKQDERFRVVPPMRGAVGLVQSLHKAGIPIALATGSNRRNFEVKTGHLPELFSLFEADTIITADSPEVKPGRGKPQPDIFLVAAEKLGRDVGTADSCTDEQRAERAKGLVFEDAKLGVIAGVAAGMNVVWVPDPELLALNPGENYGAKQVLEHLEEFHPAQWGLPTSVNTTIPALSAEAGQKEHQYAVSS